LEVIQSYISHKNVWNTAEGCQNFEDWKEQTRNQNEAKKSW